MFVVPKPHVAVEVYTVIGRSLLDLDAGFRSLKTPADATLLIAVITSYLAGRTAIANAAADQLDGPPSA